MLIGVEIGRPLWNTSDSLDELEQLAATAGVEVVGRVTQKLNDPHPATLVGKGKLEEIKATRDDLATLFAEGEAIPGARDRWRINPLTAEIQNHA